MSSLRTTDPMKFNPFFLLAGVLASAPVPAAEPGALRPTAERMANACGGCHGTYGHAKAPTPVIAGKPEDEFIAAMREFKSGQRVSSVMNRIARGYTDEDFAAMAKFFKNR